MFYDSAFYWIPIRIRNLQSWAGIITPLPGTTSPRRWPADTFCSPSPGFRRLRRMRNVRDRGDLVKVFLGNWGLPLHLLRSTRCLIPTTPFLTRVPSTRTTKATSLAVRSIRDSGYDDRLIRYAKNFLAGKGRSETGK